MRFALIVFFSLGHMTIFLGDNQTETTFKQTYIAQTNRNFNMRWDEHAHLIERKCWQHSGITQHYEHCQHPFSKVNLQPIHNMQGKKWQKWQKLTDDTRIREALEIRRHGCGPGKGLNEDMGAYIKTDRWDPVLSSL